MLASQIIWDYYKRVGKKCVTKIGHKINFRIKIEDDETKTFNKLILHFEVLAMQFWIT